MKTKTIAIFSVFLSLFLAVSLIPFKLPIPKSILFLGLSFPFIEKKLRYIITTIYQAYTWSQFGVILTTFRPALEAYFSFLFSIGSNTVIGTDPSQTEIVIAYLMILNPNIVNALIFYAFLSVFVLGVFTILLYAFILTSPYSVYYIGNKMGIFDLIERNTGGRIKFVQS